VIEVELADDDGLDVTGIVLTYSHTADMVRHMKTTLNIHPAVMAQLRREAARRGCTMSELVESALQLLLQSSKARPELPPLPTFKSGGHLVDIADREQLYHAMEGR
jgi:hypothetical protein